jgi:pyruvate/2-oxoacid:ferredoxin oxidoreductase beta subunit
VAYVVPGNQVLSELAHQVMNLGQSKTVTIQISKTRADGKVTTTTYQGCLLRSLDFPNLTMTGGGSYVTETAVFQPSLKRTI